LRGAQQHRLNVDESKWQPLGIGTPERPLLKDVEVSEKVNHEVV
jgi:hypothetical protein